MKITFVLPVVAQNGGMRVVAIYAAKLRAMGHDVTVVSRLPQRHSLPRQVINLLRGRPEKRDPQAAAFFEGLGTAHHQIPWKFPLEPDDVPDADVVIATWWRTAFEVAALPPSKGMKAYFVQGHEVFKPHPGDLAAGSYYLPLKKITISGWLVDIMARVYGDRDVTRIANSVDTAQFNTPPRMRNTTPRVGYVCSQQPVKGMDTIVQAIAQARVQVPDLQVLAFGADPASPSLSLPPGCDYHQLPAQDHLKTLYARCDAWLFGSRSEGFGLPILEAMACRTPVVATRAGAAPDLIDDGHNGYLVDVEDAEALAARLVDVVSLPAQDWRRMSDAAYERAHGYTWDDAAQAFESVLCEIVET